MALISSFMATPIMAPCVARQPAEFPFTMSPLPSCSSRQTLPFFVSSTSKRWQPFDSQFAAALSSKLVLSLGGAMKRTFTLFAALIFFASLLPAQNLAEFDKRVTVHKLPNGLTFVICERHEAPVFSFFTYVNAGSVQDPKGEGGLAHMF